MLAEELRGELWRIPDTWHGIRLANPSPICRCDGTERCAPLRYPSLSGPLFHHDVLTERNRRLRDVLLLGIHCHL